MGLAPFRIRPESQISSLHGGRSAPDMVRWLVKFRIVTKWFVMSQHYRGLSSVLSDGFSAYGHNLANLSLAPVHYLPDVDTRLPHRPVCGVNPIEAFVGYPFPSVFTRFRSENYA
jgi:hypothetical protein